MNDLANAAHPPIFAPHFMSILINFLTIVEVLVCLLLILLILMQRPRQEGLGATFAGDAMSNLAGAQATNVLQKGTTWLTAILFTTTILLGVLISKKQGADAKEKLFDPSAKAAAAPLVVPVATPKPVAPVLPVAPVAPAATGASAPKPTLPAAPKPAEAAPAVPAAAKPSPAAVAPVAPAPGK
jgi:preprotein translocase subunit SecG